MKKIPIGTRSVLIGAHCFFIHPWFVAIAWWKLFGFPWDGRLWFAFFTHDLGYWNMPNMDGEEGEDHPRIAARWSGDLFDTRFPTREDDYNFVGRLCNKLWGRRPSCHWYRMTMFHSRFLAKKYNAPFSQLCVADKLALALEPWWLYLPRVVITGEIHEYMNLARERTEAGEPKFASMKLNLSSRRRWFEEVCEYLRRWVEEHKDMKEDTWTPSQ